jgi:hypothetical protein
MWGAGHTKHAAAARLLARDGQRGEDQRSDRQQGGRRVDPQPEAWPVCSCRVWFRGRLAATNIVQTIGDPTVRGVIESITGVDAGPPNANDQQRETESNDQRQVLSLRAPVVKSELSSPCRPGHQQAAETEAHAGQAEHPRA